MSIVLLLGLAILSFFLHIDILIAGTVYLVMLVVLVITIHSIDTVRQETGEEIEKSLKKSNSEALKFASVGILVYNEEFAITWLSPLFKERSMDHLGEKLLLWLPELT